MDWAGTTEPKVGMEIDFTVNGNQAKSIFPIAKAQSSKHSKTSLALFAIFLGGLGIHRFLVGKTGSGIAMILIPILGLILPIPGSFFIAIFAVATWALVDFIMILTGSFTDKDGNKITD